MSLNHLQPTPPDTPGQVAVFLADYANPTHASALVSLLDAYAKDPMGGGEGLSDYAKANLVASLAARSQAFSVLAVVDDKPVGLVNCLEGFSTFACKPLVNVHDVAVLADYRGRGIGDRMLRFCEALSRDRGACKMTLEVLQSNLGAVRVYQRFGFASYQLGTTTGQAHFMQKWLK